jgi:hypothetical protein
MFAGLKRLDNGMARGVKMFGGVRVGRRIAAADLTAG